MPDAVLYPKIHGENGAMDTSVGTDGTPLFDTTMLTFALVPAVTKPHGTCALIWEVVPVPG